MKTAALPVATGLLLLALAGCQPKASVVGKWQGKSVAPPQGMAQEKASVGIKEIADGFAKAFGMEFMPDGTALMSMLGVSVTGKYSVSGNRVTYTPDSTQTIFGMKSDNKTPEPMTFTISADGREMTLLDKSGQPSTVFERAPK